MQNFFGFAGDKDKPPLALSLFVEIRKRIGEEVFASFEKIILEKICKSRIASSLPVAKRGKLLVDATIAGQSIKYPKDISLLNEEREISEKLRDELFALTEYTRNLEPIGKKQEDNI